MLSIDEHRNFKIVRIVAVARIPCNLRFKKKKTWTETCKLFFFSLSFFILISFFTYNNLEFRYYEVLEWNYIIPFYIFSVFVCLTLQWTRRELQEGKRSHVDK